MIRYIYTAAGVLILYFIFQILQKKRKNRADYLLIGVNLCIGLFLFSDVWVSEHLTSAGLILQNNIPIFLFTAFTFYVLQFLYAGSRFPRLWYLVLLLGPAFLIFNLLDHYVLNHYDQAGLVEHYNSPSLAYHFFFKGYQLFFIGILIWILFRLRQFGHALKSGFSYIETVSLEWLRNFTIIYLGSILITFFLFLGQNLGLLPVEIKEVYGVVYGLLVLSVFYLNYQGIRHYTLSEFYADKLPGLNQLKTQGAQLAGHLDRAGHQSVQSPTRPSTPDSGSALAPESGHSAKSRANSLSASKASSTSEPAVSQGSESSLPPHSEPAFSVDSAPQALPNTSSPSPQEVPGSNSNSRDPGIHQSLLRLFEEKAVYLQPQYGLKDLANDLNESTHTVSRVINTIEKRSFYDLVNGYRVKHLQQLLKDPTNRQYTILALGLDSGFNSKASINRIFKKMTGMTPKQYLDQKTQVIS